MYQQIEGIVIHGNGIGAKLGFPTANIGGEAAADIPSGVYAARVFLEDGERWPAVVNIGTRPSVTADTRRIVEAHIIGFDSQIYGQKAGIELVRFIRAEEKFAHVDDLIAQMGKDKLNAIKILTDEI